MVPNTTELSYQNEKKGRLKTFIHLSSGRVWYSDLLKTWFPWLPQFCWNSGQLGHQAFELVGQNVVPSDQLICSTWNIFEIFKGSAPLVSFALTQRKLQEIRQDTDILKWTFLITFLFNLMMIVYNNGQLWCQFLVSSGHGCWPRMGAELHCLLWRRPYEVLYWHRWC